MRKRPSVPVATANRGAGLDTGHRCVDVGNSRYISNVSAATRRCQKPNRSSREQPARRQKLREAEQLTSDFIATTAKVHCVNRCLGYVLFGDLFMGIYPRESLVAGEKSRGGRRPLTTQGNAS